MASNSWSSSCCDGFVQPSFLWEFSVTVVCVTVFFILVQNLLCIANWQEMWIFTSYPFLCCSTAGHSSIELFPLLCRLLWRKQRRVTFQTLTRRSRSIFPISNLLIPPEVETEHVWFLSDALQHMDTVTECYMGVCLCHSLVAWYHNDNLHWDIGR